MGELKIVPKNEAAKLPKSTGVYLFYEKNRIVYIGKTINIRGRIKSHFQGNSWWENAFLRQGLAERIGFIQTDSEIEALILEANLIKKYRPKFNVAWRDDKNYFYIAIAKNKDGLPYIFITHQPSNSAQDKPKLTPNTKHLSPTYIGPFVEGNALKKTMKFLRRIFPYYASAKHPKQKCTWCHLDLCPGPSPKDKEYKKNIQKLILILGGKRKDVLNSLKKEMRALAKEKRFEEAGKARDKINALEKIMAHAHVLSPYFHAQEYESDGGWKKIQEDLKVILGIKHKVKRIECYDVSNIQGKNATGSMVVFMNGQEDKSQYKKFRVRAKQEPNDIAMLKEVLTRRFLHPEWFFPQVILIDGGMAQLNAGIKIKSQNAKFKGRIISIAKGKQELFIEGKKDPILLKNLPQSVCNLIKRLDNEAHRFAITYHKKLRKRTLGLDR